MFTERDASGKLRYANTGGTRDSAFTLPVDPYVDQSLKASAETALWRLARKQEFLTSEDVRNALVAQYKDKELPALHMLGHVMRSGAKRGWITKHGYTTYTGASRHRAICTVWRSTIYIGGATTQ